MTQHETKRRPIPMEKVQDLDERLGLRIRPTSSLWRSIATEAIEAKGGQVCPIVTADGGPALYAWMYDLQEFLDEVEELLNGLHEPEQGEDDA